MESKSGNTPINPRLLKDIFRENGIYGAADARKVYQRKINSRPGKYISNDDLRTIEKRVQSWIQEKVSHIQVGSIDLLMELIGYAATVKVCNGRLPPLTQNQIKLQKIDPISEIGRLLIPFRDDPHLIYQDKNYEIRQAIRVGIEGNSKPLYCNSAKQLFINMERFSNDAIRLASMLKGIIQSAPVTRDSEGFDVPFLCALARLAHDLIDMVHRQLLPLDLSICYDELRCEFYRVIGILKTAAYDSKIADSLRSEALRAVILFEIVDVKIGGDSEFNISNFSSDRLLKNENRFNASMDSAIHHAREFKSLMKPTKLELSGAELEYYAKSVKYRAMCYSPTLEFRPRHIEIERVMSELVSPSSLAAKNSLLLHFRLMNKEYRHARQICNEGLQSLSTASNEVTRMMIKPIFVINSYHLKGDVTAKEYRDAFDVLRSDRRIKLLFGHHMLPKGYC